MTTQAIETHPLPHITMAQARAMQFRYVDIIARHFTGTEILQSGDYGVVPPLGRPRYTAKVEAVLAEFFETEDAALVRGAGSGALRAVCMGVLQPGSRVLVHAAPVYATTSVTFRAMGIELVRADFNDLARVTTTLREQPVDAVYVQHSRQLLEDRYDVAELIRTCRAEAAAAPILVDDNYTVFHSPRIGVQLGADLSAFSLFKILGPIGIGCVVGRAALIRRLRTDAYSGGSQVQGPEAMDALRSIVFAPVQHALGAEVVDEIVRRLNAGEVPGVVRAYVGNHQERNVMLELERPIAPLVVQAADALGASPYPVGSASRFEVGLLIYRLSRAMIEADPSLAERFLRVNPFRAGADTVMRILKEAIATASARATTARGGAGA
ncbi:MAG TPA: aminotransferase class V-fold PLP-dependent enzyme [Candidatus Limnocylindrales bacterium]|nr:aminotransferase class V-fold PLP-dependent enzyme [Candidatus Limnocylindrales bacterium]